MGFTMRLPKTNKWSLRDAGFVSPKFHFVRRIKHEKPRNPMRNPMANLKHKFSSRELSDKPGDLPIPKIVLLDVITLVKS